MASEQHKKAMDYIYDREQEEHVVKCQYQECNALVDLYEDPIFVVKVGEAQERWCRRCWIKHAKKVRW